MSCCSQKRLELTRAFNPKKGSKEKSSLPILKNINTKFKYTGNTAWFYRGALTHIRYHFKYHGHIITIDTRDVSAAMAEPLLENIV
ncbi:hypothetical protein [Aquimarina sp. AU58]|uniref:hypothetical protein n=1 Tax=Aquimarina sp. AU58 TaxID=1874112 RepID=UPI000D6E6894|nr:hypothetical protein [Aquimarina sp. AU58]